MPQQTTSVGSMPACFDDAQQWADWQYLARNSGTGRVKYCIDCLPAYHAQACEAGRCAWPNTKFVVVGSIIIGRRRGPKVKGLP